MTARPATGGVSGRWVVNTDFYGSTIYFGMELKQEGEKLSGNFDGDKLEDVFILPDKTVLRRITLKKSG